MDMKWVFRVHMRVDMGMKWCFRVHMRVEKWMISTIVLVLGRIWFFCGFQKGCVHVCLGRK